MTCKVMAAHLLLPFAAHLWVVAKLCPACACVCVHMHVHACVHVRACVHVSVVVGIHVFDRAVCMGM